MPISQAKVKSALSGDTLVLSSVNNPSQERILSLAFVSAPRMKRDGDEVSHNVDSPQDLAYICCTCGSAGVVTARRNKPSANFVQVGMI